jgi:predicted DNA-binding ribbon-helix-helix protein
VARVINAHCDSRRDLEEERQAMKSRICKRSIGITGHKTSVSLEDPFWTALKEIAVGRAMTLSDLVALIDSQRQSGNLSSAIRLFVLGFYRDQISEHEKRGTTREMLADATIPIAKQAY